MIDTPSFKVVDDEKQLRDHHIYQNIRHEVNRRLNPLSGGTDWHKVYVDCQTLCHSEGSDLLVACYFAVASLKERGIAGLADALELQWAVLDKFGTHSIFPTPRRIELLAWQTSRLLPELKRLKPEIEQLRDLYRCERTCQALDEMMQQLQDGQATSLDALGLVIFEHIDEVESQFRRTPKVPVDASLPVSQGRLRWALLGAGLAIVVLAPLGLRTRTYEPSPLWQRLTYPVKLPQSLSLAQGAALDRHFTHQQLEQQRTGLTALYRQRIESLINRPVYWSYEKAYALVNTIKRLYPNDSDVVDYTQQLSQARLTTQTLYQQQLSKFSQARTDFSNLQQALVQQDMQQATRLATQLKRYSQGLSPIYGQLSYIEQLLAQHQTQKAREQLQTLNQRLWAVQARMQQLASAAMYTPKAAP
ncbi:type VI secretion system ImpA family N-terminal domain-containing protein [Celerinatantimonas yamalensis]|uniref:Type VI secretion system ImpA family N-terminal domain-containing protein n=1 Tax=Celerinatantimonas yamalensis TaxID=559956 RepID=A0ABW9G442_9GAMM